MKATSRSPAGALRAKLNQNKLKTKTRDVAIALLRVRRKQFEALLLNQQSRMNDMGRLAARPADTGSFPQHSVAPHPAYRPQTALPHTQHTHTHAPQHTLPISTKYLRFALHAHTTQTWSCTASPISISLTLMMAQVSPVPLWLRLQHNYRAHAAPFPSSDFSRS